jgi:carbonic anhydrase
MDADEVIRQLQQGNRRFVRGERLARDLVLRRAELLAGQAPLATVVCCSDSRVVPELIFDANLGDIFTVESAGNVLDEVGLASVEYGVEHLGTAVLLILGHTRCGAVAACCGQGSAPGGRLGAILRRIEPAAARHAGDVESAVDENVRLVRDYVLAESEVVQGLAGTGRVRIVLGVYRMESGEVHFQV